MSANAFYFGRGGVQTGLVTPTILPPTILLSKSKVGPKKKFARPRQYSTNNAMVCGVVYLTRLRTLASTYILASTSCPGSNYAGE